MTREILNRHLPVVAIVGRPNVGKSTLFNRLTGHRKAVVLDTPGLTRDRNYLAAEWEGRYFLVVDTGGYELDDTQPLLRQMREQTLLAVEESDAIIFLTELDDPLNPTDDEVMNILRRTRKPVFLTVNKCDNRERRDAAASDFARFGTDVVYGISAQHGSGTDELLDALIGALPEHDRESAAPEEGIRIAVVGRPNVGKSTLVNKILGFERTIASAVPGTTRDSIDTTFSREGKVFTLIDTAGIRRRGKVARGAEKLSVVSAIMSIERCDIAIVLIDGSEGLTDQDAHVAGYAVDAGCGIVLAVNKWDAVEKDEKTAGEFARMLREELGFLKHAPIIQISAKTGQRVEKLFDLILAIEKEYTREIDTSEINDFLKRATGRLSPPVHSGRQLKIKYVTQTGTRPPTFTFFVNDPKLLHFSYERYLLNQLREEYGFAGVPVRMRFRKKSEDAPEFLGKHGRKKR